MENSNPIYFPKTSRVREEITKIGGKAAKELYNVEDLTQHLNEIYQKEYKDYLSKELYFPGCPFRIYQKHYEDRLQEYRVRYPDADEFDFLENEDSLFWQLSEMDVESKNNFYSFYPHLYSDPHRRNIGLSIIKMHEFIDKKILELGHYFKGPAGVDPIDYSSYPRKYFKPEKNPDIKTVIAQPQQKNKKQDIEPTATQWALYHFVLQEKKIKPRFGINDSKINEFKILQKEYGRHWNNLQGRWNSISNSEGQLGYHESDVVIVKEMITKEHPEALSKLEEIANKLIQ